MKRLVQHADQHKYITSRSCFGEGLPTDEAKSNTRNQLTYQCTVLSYFSVTGVNCLCFYSVYCSSCSRMLTCVCMRVLLCIIYFLFL